MGWVPIVMGVVGGISNIIGGAAQKNQADAEAAAYRQQAQNAITAGDQAEAARRTDLISTLSAVNAIRASRGLDVASPTGMAIAGDLTKRAEAGIHVTRLNALNTASTDLARAGIAKAQGQAALIGGFLKGGTSLLGAGYDAHVAGYI